MYTIWYNVKTGGKKEMELHRLMTEDDLENRGKYLGFKLLKENKGGLSKWDCIREIKSFLGNLGATRATRLKVLGTFLNRWK